MFLDKESKHKDLQGIFCIVSCVFLCIINERESPDKTRHSKETQETGHKIYKNCTRNAQGKTGNLSGCCGKIPFKAH